MTYVNYTLTESIGQINYVPSYTVKATIDIANGISPALFTFRADTDLFSHVATVNDLLFTPDSKESVLGESAAPFYRQKTVTISFTNKISAIAFSQMLRERINLVTKDWDKNSALSFGGEQTIIVEATNV
jgi:hypothetical protein